MVIHGGSVAQPIGVTQIDDSVDEKQYQQGRDDLTSLAPLAPWDTFRLWFRTEIVAWLVDPKRLTKVTTQQNGNYKGNNAQDEGNSGINVFVIILKVILVDEHCVFVVGVGVGVASGTQITSRVHVTLVIEKLTMWNSVVTVAMLSLLSCMCSYVHGTNKPHQSNKLVTWSAGRRNKKAAGIGNHRVSRAVSSL